MVAKITSPHSIKRALNYNEKKVQKGQAVCLYAGNFLKDLEELNFYNKLQRFENLISLNQRAQKSNTLHISLNFDPTEKLDRKTLIAIAGQYMDKIGFGKQPYLVYEHSDAGHPHIHIVTTNIQTSGKRIDTFNIGRLKSEPARKEIEKEFGLIQAAGRNQIQTAGIIPEKIEYGKSETKRSITNVLDRVINHYNYNSLGTLNAILKGFNIAADRGREGGRIHKNNGLIYHILDQSGNKIGVPVKASSIYSNPTLANLEKQFTKNAQNRVQLCRKLKAVVDNELSKNPESLLAFCKELSKYNIQTIHRKNASGFLYGISFVDHRNKSVFNGGEIGKEFSAAALQKRFGVVMLKIGESQNYSRGNSGEAISQKSIIQSKTFKNDKVPSRDIISDKLLRQLLQTGELEPKIPYELMRKKRKKKRWPGI